MRGYEHFLFSLLIASALLWPLEGEEWSWVFLFSIGALLPDLDATYSASKRGALGLLPRWGDRTLRVLSLLALPLLPFFDGRHRGCFHSLYAALGLFLWLYFLSSLIGIGWQWALAVSLGFMAHIIEDGATPKGVRPLCTFSIKGHLKGWRYLLLDLSIVFGLFLLPFHPSTALFVALLGYAVAFL